MQPRTTTIVLRWFGQMKLEARLRIMQQSKATLHKTRFSVLLDGNMKLVDWEDFVGGSSEEELDRC